MSYERFISQQQVDMHARSKNTFIHFPYLLNDSQTIRSTIHFSKPFFCVTLICGDWSDWSISFPFHKAAFVSAVLLCVQPLPGKQLFLPLQKRHLVAKNELAFSFRLTRKSTDGFKQQTRRAVNVNRYIYPTGEAPPHIECKSVGNTVAVFSKMTGTQHKVGAILLWYCFKNEL